MKEDQQNRLYSEKEIAALFRRASELQNAETAGTAPGLSFSEVERIARDLGIDPRYVEAAAMDLRAGGSPAEKRSLIGAPVLIEGGRLASKDVQSIAGIAQPQQHAMTAADQGMELSDGSEYGVIEETQRQRQREYDAE